MHLLIFGHGYTAAALTPRLIDAGWTVSGTTRRNPDRVAASGATPLLWEKDRAAIRAEIARADAILVCVAPDSPRATPATDAVQFSSDFADTAQGGAPIARYVDPVVAEFAPDLIAAPARWVGYLSSTNVYGNHHGGWVDETTEPSPTMPRAVARLQAEREWSALAHQADWPLSIFRLAGIYGPDRGPFAKLRAGTARRIIKPGQVFSRIHVEDIAGALMRSLSMMPDTAANSGKQKGNVNTASPNPTDLPVSPNAPLVFNLCDDEPAPPEDVIDFAAALLGVPSPPAEPIAEAEMTPMARSFYADSKRVRNDRMKQRLGYSLRYPDYRTGLRALLAAEDHLLRST